jgi:hypothetical protein
MNTTIRNCARCGGTHEDIEMKTITRPVLICNIMFNYFAMCPNTNEPIVIEVKEKPEPDKM